MAGLFIEQAKWDALSEVEQKLMATAGFERQPDPVGKKKKSRNPITEMIAAYGKSTAPTPYYANVITKCLCCGEVTERTGKMDLPYERAPYLRFRNLEENELLVDVKIHRKERKHCPNCEDNLMSMDKLVLVNMILNGNRYFEEKNYVMPTWELQLKDSSKEEEKEVVDAKSGNSVAA